MNSHLKPLRKIVIVGGGTSGWMAAAMLASHLGHGDCEIELVESEDVKTIGIGESTIPPFVRLIQQLGIDEQEFMHATQACFKLGIKFVDWRQPGSSYFHPFGAIGSRVDSHDFYQCWLRAKHEGDQSQLQDYSPCAVMAAKERFSPPHLAPHTPLGIANYAIHIDAKHLAGYLQGYAEQRGVRRIEGLVTDVVQHSEGKIEKVLLDDGRSISGDFFIDCTGFRALLIEKTLHAGFEDWSHYLPCDRAIAVKTEPGKAILPYTTATARKAGWSWRIPLRGSTGHGYVYSSRFCSDSEAKSTLLKHLDGPRISEPTCIPFATGRRRAIWKQNCLAVGLSAGFIEPLESTAIHLIARGMDFFLRFFPDRDCAPSLIREYNRRMNLDFEEVRDFIVLHYCLSQRRDTAFWRWCGSMDLPESLRDKIELFQAHGLVREGVDELFRNSSWQSVFEGMGVRPNKYCPRVNHLDGDHLRTSLDRTRTAIDTMVKNLPSHDDYLRRLFSPGL